MFVLLATTTYMSVSGSGHHERMFVRLFLWMLAIVTAGMLGDVLAWGVGLEEFAWAVPLQAVGSFLRDSMGRRIGLGGPGGGTAKVPGPGGADGDSRLGGPGEFGSV